MLIIRPIQEQDLDALYELTGSAGNGLTTLPRNRDILLGKIRKARDTFEGRCAPEAGLYLFVLEDTEQNRCVGVSGIQARVGLDEVFYNYRLSITVHDSRELDVHVRTPTLYLTNDMTDATEIGSLLLSEDYRGGGNGLLLSRSRFLFLGEFRQHFSDKIFAEMRGVSDDQGVSPLWEALGRRFFDMEFVEADRLSGLGNKSFIAELMPRFPIYLSLLPESATDAIGKVHRDTRPALDMLRDEGFNFNGLVDIFDGGPLLEAFLHNIRSIRQSTVCRVVRDETVVVDKAPMTNAVMVCNRSFDDFRVGLLPANMVMGHELRLPGVVLSRLRMTEDDEVLISPLKEGPF